MDMKKIFAALFVLAMFSTLGLVCATENIGGIEFNMVDGFIQNGMDLTVGASHKEVITFSKGSEDIIINVTIMDPDAFDKEFSSLDQKTINGQTGFLDKSTHTFHYMNDTQAVAITVPDESYLEKIVP